jgi:predicted ATPase
MPHYLGRLAALHCRAGRRAAGLRIIEEAAATAAATSETWCDAELQRCRGELLLLDPAESAEAEASFRTAIEIATKQGAPMLRLRASVPLTRMLIDQGKQEQGLALLRPIFDWFTEGHATSDIREADHLLRVASFGGQDGPAEAGHRSVKA